VGVGRRDDAERAVGRHRQVIGIDPASPEIAAKGNPGYLQGCAPGSATVAVGVDGNRSTDVGA
jgi:hypothetical protein